MLPLSAALAVLLVPAQAQGPAPKFKRTCQNYAPDKTFEQSEATVRKVVDAYAQGARRYTFLYVQDETRSPDVTAPGYPHSKLMFVEWGPALWNKSFTHGDYNQVKCVLAHEAAHAKLEHPFKHRDVVLERAPSVITPQKREAINKELASVDCKPDGTGGHGCKQLKAVLEEKVLMDDPELFQMYRAGELEADRQALYLLRDVEIDGKKADPWGCWSLMFQMPAPPANPQAPRDPHPTGKERAQAMAAELQKMGVPQPCL